MSAPPPLSFSSLLDAQAKQRGRSIALHFEGDEISYAELALQAKRMAASLSERGIGLGDRVAYLGLNHPLQIALLFACAQLGAIFAPLNYRLAVAEWQTILHDCQPALIAADAEWISPAEALQTASRPVVSITQLMQAEPFDSTPTQDAGGTLLVYTSGTTGQPKGALHSAANLMANMRIAAAKQAATATDSVASMLPLFHVGGLCIQTLPALLVGARVILHARFEPGAALKTIHHMRPSLTLQVPATMRAMIEHPDWGKSDLSSLQTKGLWAGSSILPTQLVEAFHARGIPVCNVYGSTETGPFSICLPPEKAFDHVGSCGWPANESVEVSLLGEKAGVGELLIRAPNVAQHYWPRLDLKDESGWFHTGDLAKRAADGSYSIVGRCKDMWISGGENIYPAEIENVLLAHPAVQEAAVLGLPDAKWGEMTAACLVLKAGFLADDTQAQLELTLNEQLARYKQPKRWFFLTELPKTALGKVQKDWLKSRLLVG